MYKHFANLYSNNKTAAAQNRRNIQEEYPVDWAQATHGETI